MSDLRTQLDLAKQQYASARYPGDLAADVLPTTRHFSALRISAWTITAIAASVAAMLFISRLQSSGTSTKTNTVAVQTPTTNESTAVATEVAPSLSVPDGLELVPTAQSVSFPSTPSLPSMEAMIEQQNQTSTSTTQESA